jgi:lipid A oxidase
MRLVVAVTLSLLVGALLSPAHARAETGVSFYAGKAWTADATVTLEEPGSRLEFNKVSWSDESFTSPIYYGIRITHWFGSSTGWGAGLDFTHIKMYAGLEDSVMVAGSREGVPVSNIERLGDTFSSLSFSHGHNVLLATGFYRWVPAPEASWLSRIHPHVGFGLGVGITHVEVDVAASSTDEYQLTGPAIQGLAGTEIVIIPRLRGILEYKLIYAHIVADLSGGGTLTVNPWTHQFTFGASVILFN